MIFLVINRAEWVWQNANDESFNGKLRVSAPPIISAEPVNTDSEPFGKPARSARSAKASADSGVCIAGFTTIKQPAPSAGPALRVSIAVGKFYGVVAAVTPIGCLIVITRRSPVVAGMTSPYTRRASSANHSMSDAA